MVSADPAPKPAAVSPAARPRRSGNHLRALPMQVPYTAPAFDRNQPGLSEDEDRKGDLDRSTPPMVLLVYRIDKQCPPVLQVSDHHHADDARQQLEPADFSRSSAGGGRRG